MAEERVVITFREDGSRVVSRRLRDIAASSDAADAATNRLQGSISRQAAASGRLRDELGRFVSANAAASRQVGATVASIDRMGPTAGRARDALGRFVSSGQTGLQQLSSAASKARRALGGLGDVLKALTAALIIRSLVQAADAFTTLSNRLALVTSSTEQAIVVQRELFEIAQRTRTEFVATGELYSRLAQATKNLGETQRTTLEITETINKAIVLSGATANEASAGMIQFAQGLASGKLSGDELRSVLEQLPALADILAKEFDVTRGQLRKLGSDGKLTTDRIISALKNARKEIDTNFAKTTPTIAQSVTVLNNAFINFVGNADRSSGVSKALSRAIIGLANNIDILAAAVAALGVILTAVFAASLVRRVSAVITVLRALFVLIAANPIFALIAALTAVVAALFVFRDQITILKDGVTTFGDLLRAAFELAKFVIIEIANTIKELLAPAIKFLVSLIPDIDISFEGVLRGVIRVADLIVGAMLGAIKAVIAAFKELPGALAEIFIDAMNGILQAVGAGVNKVAGILNELPGVEIGKIKFDEIENDAQGSVRQLGTSVRDAFLDGLNQTFLTELTDTLLTRAAQIGEDRRAREKQIADRANLDARRPGAQKTATGDGKARDNLLKDLRALEDSLDPILAAQRQLADGRALLGKALRAGLIDADRAVKVEGLLAESLRDQLDPLGRLNRELEEQRTLLGLSADERELEVETRARLAELQQAGLRLSEEESQRVRQTIAEQQRLSRELEAQGAILDRLRGPQREYANTIAALNSLLQAGKITQQEYADSVLDANAAMLATQTSGVAGLKLGLIELFQQTRNLAETVKSAVLSIFGQIEDSLVDLVVNGSTDFKKLADSILRDITRIAIRALILQGVTAAFGGTPGGAPAALSQAVAGGGGAAQLPGFRTGGSFMVGGSGAPDSQLVAFRASPGERVDVTPPGRSGRERGNRVNNTTVNVSIQTRDAGSFMASRSQVGSSLRRAVTLAKRDI